MPTPQPLALALSHNSCLLGAIILICNSPVKLIFHHVTLAIRGWSGGAMVLGKLPVPGRPTIWITVGQGPTALVVGAGGG